MSDILHTVMNRTTRVNVPVEMAKAVDKVVANKKFGYKSRDDFVRDAIRESLMRVGVLA